MTTFEKVTAACCDLAGTGFQLEHRKATPEMINEVAAASGGRVERSTHVGGGRPAETFEVLAIEVAGTHVRLQRMWLAERGEPVGGHYCRDRGFMDATEEEINAAFQEVQS
jgi:hypothetical protein